MLQAFEGLIDANGLRSLRQGGGPARLDVDSTSEAVPFWAVLDTQAASQVLKELLAGNRRFALSLLEATAKSLGSIPPR